MRNLKVSKPFLEHNKMESKNKVATYGSACAVPSGNKTFSRNKKCEFPSINLKCQKPFPRHNKMERISYYGFCYRRDPSGDKT